MVIVASGYFDPIHIGHLEYLQLSKKLGGKLVVIVNSDKQAKIKKGKSFMPEDERIKIVKSIKWVDEVILSIDEDLSVCETITFINTKQHVDILTNGGDIQGTCREEDTCNKLNIKLVYGLGDKIQASSNLTGIK